VGERSGAYPTNQQAWNLSQGGRNQSEADDKQSLSMEALSTETSCISEEALLYLGTDYDVSRTRLEVIKTDKTAFLPVNVSAHN
jgi:hypothetical protein